jgi:hypothetical protein
MLFRRGLNCDKNDENMKRNFGELNDEEASDEFSETAVSTTHEDLAIFDEILGELNDEELSDEFSETVDSTNHEDLTTSHEIDEEF